MLHVVWLTVQAVCLQLAIDAKTWEEIDDDRGKCIGRFSSDACIFFRMGEIIPKWAEDAYSRAPSFDSMPEAKAEVGEDQNGFFLAFNLDVFLRK